MCAEKCHKSHSMEPYSTNPHHSNDVSLRLFSCQVPHMWSQSAQHRKSVSIKFLNHCMCVVCTSVIQICFFLFFLMFFFLSSRCQMIWLMSPSVLTDSNCLVCSVPVVSLKSSAPLSARLGQQAGSLCWLLSFFPAGFTLHHPWTQTLAHV